MEQQVAEKTQESTAAPATAAASPAPAAAAPAAAAPGAGEPKKVDEKKVASTVDALEAELGARFYTNDKKVTEALRGKSPDEIAAIRQQYKDKTGKDMDELVQKHVSGKDLEEANAILKGDKAKAASLGLQDAIKPGDVNKSKMNAILEDVNAIKDPKERQETLDKIKADYATATGSSLEDMIKAGTNKVLTSDKSNHDMQAALALAGGNKDKAEAVKLDEKLKSGVLGVGKDTEGVQAALDGKSPEEQARIAKAYKDHTGKDLKTAVGDELSGADKTAATAKIEANEAAATAASKDATPEQKAEAQKVVARKEAEAAAARIEASMGTITDKKALMKSLEMKTTGDDGKPLPPEEQAKEREKHRAMVAAYDARYGADAGGQNLRDKLKTELGGLDAEKAHALARDGKLSDEMALKVAMKGGIFVDKDGIKKALKNPDGSDKSAEQIDELKKKYGAGFDKDLVDAAGGASKDSLEIDQLLRGKPESAQEELERARERHQHERGGGASQAVMDVLSNRGEKLDAQQARLEGEYKKLADKEARGETVTEADKKAFDKVKDFQGRDAKLYGDAKNNVADTAGTAAGVLAGAGVTLLTGGAAAPALAAALSAGTGTAATMATKAAIKGGDYEGKELALDAASGAAGALTAGAAKAGAVGRALNRAAGVQPTSATPYAFQSGTFAQELGKGAATGAAQSAVNEGTRATVEQLADGQNATRALYNASGKALKAAGTGALNSAVTGAISNGIPPIGAAPASRAEEVARATRMGALGGAAGGAATTTVDLAINGSQGASGVEIAGKYGGAVAGGAITGAADANATKRTEHRTADRERAEAAGRPLTEQEQHALRTAKELEQGAEARKAATPEQPDAAALNERIQKLANLRHDERLNMSPEEIIRFNQGKLEADKVVANMRNRDLTGKDAEITARANLDLVQDVQKGATFVKALPPEQAGELLSGHGFYGGKPTDSDSIRGFGALSRDKANVTGRESVANIGPEYPKSPFVTDAGDGKVKLNEQHDQGGVFGVRKVLSEADAAQIKVPVTQEVASAGGNDPRLRVLDKETNAAPWTGTGSAAPSDRLVDPRTGKPWAGRFNQELKIDGALKLAPGDQLTFRGAEAKTDQVLATYGPRHPKLPDGPHGFKVGADVDAETYKQLMLLRVRSLLGNERAAAAAAAQAVTP